MTTLCAVTFATSKAIETERNIQDVLTHLVTEVGELATEVQVATGRTYKKGDVDGIVGEAVDVILCALDIIYLHEGAIDEPKLVALAQTKLNKWKNSVRKQ